VTKQNPRPRKYASDAERQAAYRSRAAEVCVRLEPKTMATLDSIAEEIGYSRNELMQSMVKFGLTNRDWRNEGLTAHKRLPRYQENPGMATKPPSPAQLAARERFAEMARSGSLNRKRQIAAKKNASVKKNPVGYKYRSYLDEYATKTDDELRYIIKDASEAALAMRGHSPASEEKYLDQVNDASTILYRRRRGLDEITADPKIKRKRKTNPGLYDNINAKRARIAAGSGERMRRPGTKGAPTEEAFKRSAMTARKSNPQTKSVKSTSPANFAYCVEAKRSLGSAGSVFEMVAGFNTKTQAQNYIDAILASNPGVTLRIKAYK